MVELLNAGPSILFAGVIIYFAYRGRAAFFDAWAAAPPVERVLLLVATVCLFGMAFATVLEVSGVVFALLGVAIAATVMRWILQGRRVGKITPRR